MTYRQMRLLFAGLARYDGRLSVLVARNDVPVGLWTVVLRDHVRHSSLGIRRIEELVPDEQEGAPLVPWDPSNCLSHTPARAPGPLAIGASCQAPAARRAGP
jgi:hypothetical protein